jgi:hypothetical protein
MNTLNLLRKIVYQSMQTACIKFPIAMNSARASFRRYVLFQSNTIEYVQKTGLPTAEEIRAKGREIESRQGGIF